MTSRLLVPSALLAAIGLTAAASAGSTGTPRSSLTLRGPAHQTTITSPDPSQAVVTLSWRAAPGAAAYRIVVSTSTDLSRPLVQRTRADSFAAVRGLPEGQYYWRVEALDRPGAVVGVSDVTSFLVRTGAP